MMHYKNVYALVLPDNSAYSAKPLQCVDTDHDDFEAEGTVVPSKIHVHVLTVLHDVSCVLALLQDVG